MIAEFIPIVGTYLAGAAPVLGTLAAVGPVAAAIVLVELLVYRQADKRRRATGLRLTGLLVAP